MTDDQQSALETLDDFLGQHAGIDIDGPAMLTGWVMVLEWADDEGNRWLSRLVAPSVPSWQADGMYHEALYGDWDNDDED